MLNDYFVKYDFYTTKKPSAVYFIIVEMFEFATKFSLVLDEIKNIRYIEGGSYRTFEKLYCNDHQLSYKKDNTYERNLPNQIPANFQLYRSQETIKSIIAKENPHRWCGTDYKAEGLWMELRNVRLNLMDVITQGDIAEFVVVSEGVYRVRMVFNTNKIHISNAHFPYRQHFIDNDGVYKNHYIINIQTRNCSCPGWKYHKKCHHQRVINKHRSFIRYHMCLVMKKHFDFTLALTITTNYLN